MDISVTYERDWGLGWIAAEPAFMQRASHALAHEGRVWLVDPVDGEGLEDRLARLGEVRGVLQLLDVTRATAPRWPAATACRCCRPRSTAFPGPPSRRSPWWAAGAGARRPSGWPARRALVVAEALGTAPYFPARGREPQHRMHAQRLAPRALAGFGPEHLLVGHGPPLHGPDVAERVRRAIARSRREIPRWLAGLPAARRARMSAAAG